MTLKSGECHRDIQGFLRTRLTAHAGQVRKQAYSSFAGAGERHGRYLHSRVSLRVQVAGADGGRGMMSAHPYKIPVACPQCHIFGSKIQGAGNGPAGSARRRCIYLHEDGGFAPADVLKRLKVDYPWNLCCTEEEVDSIPSELRCPKCGK